MCSPHVHSYHDSMICKVQTSWTLKETCKIMYSKHVLACEWAQNIMRRAYSYISYKPQTITFMWDKCDIFAECPVLSKPNIQHFWVKLWTPRWYSRWGVTRLNNTYTVCMIGWANYKPPPATCNRRANHRVLIHHFACKMRNITMLGEVTLSVFTYKSLYACIYIYTLYI